MVEVDGIDLGLGLFRHWHVEREFQVIVDGRLLFWRSDRRRRRGQIAGCDDRSRGSEKDSRTHRHLLWLSAPAFAGTERMTAASQRWRTEALGCSSNVM